MRLGKLAPRRDDRTLLLARYVDLSSLPTPPESTNRARSAGVHLGMWGNDRIGDCVIAGRANLRTFWSGVGGHPVEITDDEVIATYSRLSGYDPATGANDTGLVELDALNDWRTVPFAGETIDAYAQIHDEELSRVGIWAFDGIYGGYQLPESALEQFRGGEPFTVVADSPVAGGHCMVELDYDADYVYLGTWGQVVPATWEWIRTFRDEAYVVLSHLDQIRSTGVTAEGFDLAALQADLATVTG